MTNYKFGKFILFATAASVACTLQPGHSLVTYSCYIAGRLIVNKLSRDNIISNRTRDILHYALGGFIFGKFYSAFNWIYSQDFVNSILFSDQSLEVLPTGMNYIYQLSLISTFKSTFLLSLPLFCVGFLNENLDGDSKASGFDYMKVCRNLFISSSVRYFTGHLVEHNLFSTGSYFLGGIAGSLMYEILDGGLKKPPLFSKESKFSNFNGFVIYKSVRDLCTSTLSSGVTYLPFVRDVFCAYDIVFSALSKVSDLYFLDDKKGSNLEKSK